MVIWIYSVLYNVLWVALIIISEEKREVFLYMKNFPIFCLIIYLKWNFMVLSLYTFWNEVLYSVLLTQIILYDTLRHFFITILANKIGQFYYIWKTSPIYQTPLQSFCVMWLWQHDCLSLCFKLCLQVSTGICMT